MNYQTMQFQAREKQQLFHKEAQGQRGAYSADKLAAARFAAIAFLIVTTTALFYIL